MAHQAQDTFIAVLKDGTERRVAKGEPFSDRHELVVRDQEAQRANPDRTPLFARMTLDDEEEGAPARRPRGRPRKIQPEVAAAADEEQDGEQ
jgi:hypothetical protein